MSEIYIIYNNKIIANAVVRYIKYNMDIDEIDIDDINDSAKYFEIFEKAEDSSLIIAEAFSGKNPKGFHLVKELTRGEENVLKQKILLIFYPGEIDINTVGDFWMRLPEEIDSLNKIIRKALKNLKPQKEDYEKLEKRFPELKEKKGHH